MKNIIYILSIIVSISCTGSQESNCIELKKENLELKEKIEALTANDNSFKHTPSSSSSKYEQKSNTLTFDVYICTSSSAYAYHKYRQCESLINCNSSIKAISNKQVLKSNRKYCRICFEE